MNDAYAAQAPPPADSHEFSAAYLKKSHDLSFGQSFGAQTFSQQVLHFGGDIGIIKGRIVNRLRVIGGWDGNLFSRRPGFDTS